MSSALGSLSSGALFNPSLLAEEWILSCFCANVQSGPDLPCWKRKVDVAGERRPVQASRVSRFDPIYLFVVLFGLNVKRLDDVPGSGCYTPRKRKANLCTYVQPVHTFLYKNGFPQSWKKYILYKQI